MAQSSDSGLQKDRSVRSVGHKNCVNQAVGPSSSSVSCALHRSIKRRRRARWRRPAALHISFPSRAQHRYPGVYQTRHIPLQELPSPTRSNRLSLTTTTPIKLRRITRSWRPFFITTQSIIRKPSAQCFHGAFASVVICP